MHTNFYHWHARVEIKPDTNILNSRWEAAVKFGKSAKASDIAALLSLMLFSSADQQFAQKFGEDLVKVEPSFPLANRDELLRVMAAATLSSIMESSNATADAAALGIRSAAFGSLRAEIIWQDVRVQANAYLSAESEKVRPASYSAEIEKAEKQMATHIALLKKAVETNEPAKIGEATQTLATGLSAAVKDSHKQLGSVIERVAEESQFLWWLVNEYSPNLKKRRSAVSSAAYSIVVAAEAADRVKLLPPAESLPALIEAALVQCSAGVADQRPAIELMNLVETPIQAPTFPLLVPLTGMLAERTAGAQLAPVVLTRFHLPIEAQLSFSAAAVQRFHELMFMRALSEIA